MMAFCDTCRSGRKGCLRRDSENTSGVLPQTVIREYFAEGVQSWFDNNGENDHDHNHVNTRKELIEYDPGLAAICREVFGDTVLTYTKPATRLRDHLAGYDPAKAPTFAFPERLKQAKTAIRQSVRNASKTRRSSLESSRRICHRFNAAASECSGRSFSGQRQTCAAGRVNACLHES